jgi:phospholipid/cholesterol/gamma-HCH transport system substrate-binding protein
LKISNETKVGALTAIAITCLILGYNFLKGKNLFTSARTYYAVYDETDGLTNQTAISVNGYKIGQVSDIDMIQGEGDPRFVVTFKVKGDVVIREGSVAKIYNADLFGGKAVALILGKGPNEMESGDTLLSDVELSLAKSIAGIINPVREKSDKLVATLDSVVATIGSLFNTKTQKEMGSSIEDLSKTLANLKNTTARFDDIAQSGRLENIFSNLESIVSNFQKNNAVISRTLSNFETLSDSLRASELTAVIRNAKASMDQVSLIMTKINKGEGSMGMLVNNDQLYKNLENSALSLDKLLVDLKASPSRYLHFSVFGGGKKTKAPKTPAKTPAKAPATSPLLPDTTN